MNLRMSVIVMLVLGASLVGGVIGSLINADTLSLGLDSSESNEQGSSPEPTGTAGSDVNDVTVTIDNHQSTGTSDESSDGGAGDTSATPESDLEARVQRAREILAASTPVPAAATTPESEWEDWKLHTDYEWGFTVRVPIEAECGGISGIGASCYNLDASGINGISFSRLDWPMPPPDDAMPCTIGQHEYEGHCWKASTSDAGAVEALRHLYLAGSQWWSIVVSLSVPHAEGSPQDLMVERILFSINHG